MVDGIIFMTLSFWGNSQLTNISYIKLFSFEWRIINRIVSAP